MKHVIRVLSWVTIILWILVIIFSGTVVYSAMQIGMNFEEEPEITVSNNMLTMAVPFSIFNGGLYDISKLNITTLFVGENETVISRSTTPVSLISRGDKVDETHDISISLDDILDKDLTYLFFNDTDLNLDMSVELTYAYVIPLKISSNLTMPWGAPLSNLTVREISTTLPHNVSLSFENHALFTLSGTIRLEIADRLNNLIGSGETDISVPPGGSYDDAIQVTLTGDREDVAEVRLYFDTSVSSFGPVVIPIE